MSFRPGTRLRAAELCQTGTAAAASGVTITLPAVTGEKIHITAIQIQCYATAARTGGATPTIVTTTALNGVTFNFDTAQAAGTQLEKLLSFDVPIEVAAATAATIVAPATASVIWNINVWYYTEK